MPPNKQHLLYQLKHLLKHTDFAIVKLSQTIVEAIQLLKTDIKKKTEIKRGHIWVKPVA